MDRKARSDLHQRRGRIRGRAQSTEAVAFFNIRTSAQLLETTEALLPENRERLYPPTVTLSTFMRRRWRPMARARRRSTGGRRCADIVLLAADGLDNGKIAERVGVGRVQVCRWREHYARGGLRAIERDLPRSGRKPRVDAAEIVRLTTQTKPRGRLRGAPGRWGRSPV